MIVDTWIHLNVPISFTTIYLFPLTAPGSYDVEKADKKVHESSPAFSLGVKYKESKPEDIPGNTYTFITIVWNHINAAKLIKVVIK